MSKEKNRKRMRLMKKIKTEKLKDNETNQLEKQSMENISKQLTDFGMKFKFNKKITNKVSSAISAYIKPLTVDVNSPEERRKIYDFGIATWNCGILKALGKSDEMEIALSGFPDIMDPKTKELFDTYVDYKIKFFPEYNNFVLTYDISFDNDGLMNLAVVSKKLEK